MTVGAPDYFGSFTVISATLSLPAVAILDLRPGVSTIRSVSASGANTKIIGFLYDGATQYSQIGGASTQVNLNEMSGYGVAAIGFSLLNTDFTNAFAVTYCGADRGT